MKYEKSSLNHLYHHRNFKLRLIRARQIIDITIIQGAPSRCKRQNSRCLCQCFNDHHAGKNRGVWKVTGKNGLIDGNVFKTNNTLIGVNLDNSVNQQKRLDYSFLAETFTLLYIMGTIASRPKRNNEPRTFIDITSSIELIVFIFKYLIIV